MEKILVLDRPEQIEEYRVRTLRAGLKLEIKGLKMSRGVSVSALVRDLLKSKTRSKTDLLEELNAYISKTYPTPEGSASC